MHPFINPIYQLLIHSLFISSFHPIHPRIIHCAMNSSPPKVSPHVAVSSIFFCHPTFCHSPPYSINPSFFGSFLPSCSPWFSFYDPLWQSVSWDSLYMSTSQ